MISKNLKMPVNEGKVKDLAIRASEGSKKAKKKLKSIKNSNEAGNTSSGKPDGSSNVSQYDSSWSPNEAGELKNETTYSDYAEKGKDPNKMTGKQRKRLRKVIRKDPEKAKNVPLDIAAKVFDSNNTVSEISTATAAEAAYNALHKGKLDQAKRLAAYASGSAKGDKITNRTGSDTARKVGTYSRDLEKSSQKHAKKLKKITGGGTVSEGSRGQKRLKRVGDAAEKKYWNAQITGGPEDTPENPNATVDKAETKMRTALKRERQKEKQGDARAVKNLNKTKNIKGALKLKGNKYRMARRRAMHEGAETDRDWRRNRGRSPEGDFETGRTQPGSKKARRRAELRAMKKKDEPTLRGTWKGGKKAAERQRHAQSVAAAARAGQKIRSKIPASPGDKSSGNEEK
jgi:hypothetical protein